MGFIERLLIFALFNRKFAWKIVILYARFALNTIFKVEIIVENHNNNEDLKNGNYILLGLNQESLLDALVYPASAPEYFMTVMNIEFALIPLFGWVSSIFGWVIFRQWPEHAKKKLNKVVAYLNNGGIIHISIEGKRSKDGRLNEYKKGPVVLAINAHATIIPVVIHGMRDRLPYGSMVIRPGKVIFKMLKGISTAGMSYNDRNELVNMLRNIAESVLFQNHQ